MNDNLSDVEIAAEKVWHKLRTLNGTKSCGPDNIEQCFLKACCEELSKPLIMQKSYDQSMLPDEWTQANNACVQEKGIRKTQETIGLLV